MGGVAITRSQSGIGLAISKQLASSDRAVIGIDLPGKGAEVESDLSTPEGRQRAIGAVLERCDGALDGLVCSAGVDHGPDAQVLAQNYFGAVDLLVGLREALSRSSQPAAAVSLSNSTLITPGIPEVVVEALLAGDQGRALALLKDHPGRAYAASMLALARWIRRNAPAPGWAGRGITLNGVSPGPVTASLVEQVLTVPFTGWWTLWSSMWDPHLMMPFLGNPAAREAVEELPCPLGRTTTPEQVAFLFDFLLSEKARFLVGQIIAIDGGIEATFRSDDWPAAWRVEPGKRVPVSESPPVGGPPGT
jgi:NAD(P)-dependent dehydrogenase (short-subunit alcohol dehydrogenase family)